MSCTVETIIYAGSRVRLRGTFEDLDGVVIDPDTVTFKVKDPNGVTTPYVYGVDSQLTRVSSGIYQVEQSVDIAGIWVFRYSSTGQGQAAGETTFTVTASAF